MRLLKRRQDNRWSLIHMHGIHYTLNVKEWKIEISSIAAL